MKKVKAEIWFWHQEDMSLSHWWTGTLSKFAHVAPVVNRMNLTAHVDGSEWLCIDSPEVNDEYRDADVKVPVLVPAHTLIAPKRYEEYPLPRFRIWFHHIHRTCYGYDGPEPEGTCVWLTKRVLGWNRPDLQTPDDIYKELLCQTNYQGSSESS